MDRAGRDDDGRHRLLQLCGGGVEVVAQAGKVGGEALFEADREIAVGKARQPFAQRGQGGRLRLGGGRPLRRDALLLRFDRLALGGNPSLTGLALDRVLLEHLHRLSHVADLVAALLTFDLNREIAAGQPAHPFAKALQRRLDLGHRHPEREGDRQHDANHANGGEQTNGAMRPRAQILGGDRVFGQQLVAQGSHVFDDPARLQVDLRRLLRELAHRVELVGRQFTAVIEARQSVACRVDRLRLLGERLHAPGERVDFVGVLGKQSGGGAQQFRGLRRSRIDVLRCRDARGRVAVVKQRAVDGIRYGHDQATRAHELAPRPDLATR